jgi:hypothetical protein
MTSVLKMQVPSLGHAQKCGVFKLINGIPTSPPDYCIFSFLFVGFENSKGND